MFGKHEKIKKRRIYSELNFFYKFFLFLKYLFQDIKYVRLHGRPFLEYGITMYCAPQGGGKTVSMLEYLERMRKKYPKCKIVSNFGYLHEDKAMESWQDFFDYRNGTDGVIFALDELQNEFSSTAWKTFPETLLSEVTQQRKQRVKIVATSQVFTRVAKPLREQTFEVVECYTLAGRWTFNKAFAADEYNAVIDMPNLKNKLHRKWRRNFVQTDELRDLFDSYAKIERLKKTDFVPRSERLQ